jgi:hypothetical protein
MLNFEALVRLLHERVEQIPDHRQGGNNTRYEIKDAALGAFAAFFTQSPSFLAYQQKMEDRQGRRNATSLFGIERTPSMPQIRNLLDPIAPEELYPLFSSLLGVLVKAGEVRKFRA